jgi:hypothetical protein
MISTASSSNTSFAPTYDRSGSLSLFHSEPAQRITVAIKNGSTSPKNYQDKVTLSERGIEQSHHPEVADTGDSPSTGTTDESQHEPDIRQRRQSVPQLTVAEEKVVQQLKERDQEVKTHEMAHLASAGQYARGGPTYSYQQGPDGRRYAIGGEVPIDISKEQTAEETIQKMQSIKRAAMAPAEPSSADRSIAAAATAAEAQARQELQTEKNETAPKKAQIENDTESTDKESFPAEGTADNVPLAERSQRAQRVHIIT